jgi:diacylglycerol O-acyltransferase / wax synthase
LLAVEQLRRRRLDRSRPLWEMWFLIGLPEGRVGLFVRIHHAITDGVAGVATIATFLDATPNAVPGPRRQWIPAPVPTDGELLDDQQRQRQQQLRRALSMLTHPVATGRHVLAAWPTMRELLADRPLPATSLDRLVGRGRNLALIRGSLELVTEIAHANDATVNDVLLTVTAGGLRGLLSSRGEPVDGTVLRIYVPVSLHQEPQGQARGNLIAQMVVPLPIGVLDPGLRLQLIAKETAQRKAKSRPSLGMVPHRGIAGRAFLNLVDRQRVNVTSADVPGPEVPLYFAGARLLEVFPMVQLIGKCHSPWERCRMRDSSTSWPSPTKTPTPISTSSPRPPRTSCERSPQLHGGKPRRPRTCHPHLHHDAEHSPEGVDEPA